MVIEENPFEHILYEFSMYLQTSMYVSDNQFVTNLMADSRMVHMRNIAYFFSLAKDRNKNYLHYSMYINGTLQQEFAHDLFVEIQKYSSNSTCHLLKGRLKGSFKQETAVFEQKVFPVFISLIKSFFSELNTNIRAEHASSWSDDRICNIVAGIMDLVRDYESADTNSNHVVTIA